MASVQFHRSGACACAGDVSELLSMVEDHQISVQRMLHNPYVGVLKQKVEFWARKLDVAQQVLGKEPIALLAVSRFVVAALELECG